MRRTALLLILAVSAGVADVRAAEPQVVTLTYRPDAPKPTEKLMSELARRITDRWRALDVDDVVAQVATTGDRLFVRIPARSAKREDVVRRMTETRGLVEFRVRADLKVEQGWASKVERYAALPGGHAWIPKELPRDPRKVLVETPRGEPAFTNADIASASIVWEKTCPG